jgi:hypothetical protein
MRISKTFITLSCLSLLAACGGPSQDATVPQAEPAAETSVDIGGHVVHFNSQTTDQMPPEVARSYDIVRSKNRAMLTVSVIDESTNQPVAAEISIKTVNLTGQLKNVAMRTITEQKAIYYIGETSVANREILVFDLTVRPEGVDRSSDIRFQRQFFTD